MSNTSRAPSVNAIPTFSQERFTISFRSAWACGLLPDSLMQVDPAAVTLKGFSKRASDSKESFFITNNTSHRMSAVRLLMRYTTMQGEMLTQRTVTVPVSLKPGETKLVSIKSFDVQRLFYYYAGPQPRKQATPFKVAFRLTGYDIPVGN